MEFKLFNLKTQYLIIIQIKMRNQRNTTNDNYKNQSKERKTGNSHYLYSQNRNHGNNNRAN